MPRRIQLRRAKGWRLPEGATTVARPSYWGNPNRIGQPDPERDGALFDRATAVERYEAQFRAGVLPYGAAEVRSALKGRDLACWCPLDGPCHADFLLRIANE